MKVALGGGTPRDARVPVDERHRHRTVDENSVYWLTSDPGKCDGALWKLTPK
jgi:hypothetical protein